MNKILSLSNHMALIAVAVTSLTTGALSQDEPRPTTEQIVARYNALMDTNEKNGFSGVVLVEKEGELIFHEAYGYADKANKIENTTETLFDIGSITKQFTAAGILKLMEDGKLTVDDPLSKFFETVPDDKKDITIHQLLTHSAGISGYTGEDYDLISDEAFLAEVFQRKLKSKPGETHKYANVGYSLLGMIIERVSGQPYETYLYENIFKPAGMENTGYLRLDPSQYIVAQGYNYGKNKLWGSNIERWAEDGGVSWHLKANGGILSTTGDMYKWHRALQDKRVLKPETITLYQAPHVPQPGTDKHYAYGWETHPANSGGQIVKHNGGNGIFFAMMQRYVDQDTTFYYVTNEASPGAYGLLKELIYVFRYDDYKAEVISKPTWFGRIKARIIY